MLMILRLGMFAQSAEKTLVKRNTDISQIMKYKNMQNRRGKYDKRTGVNFAER